MNKNSQLVFGFCGMVLVAGLSGCATSDGMSYTNQRHIGPMMGKGLGTGIGLAGGNAVGGVVGLGEGIVKGSFAPFDNTVRMIRYWKTVQTSDGRTIQVPEDIYIDQYGRPLGTASKQSSSKP